MMIDFILDKIKNFFTSRTFPIIIIYSFLLFVLINRVFQLQVVEGNHFVENLEFKSNKTRDLKSTRGNIYDAKGNLLAYNELSYSVILEDSTLITSNEQRNDIIFNLIKILEENQDEVDYDFFIKINKKGNFVFTIEGDELIRFKRKAYEYTFSKDNKELTDEQLNASAEEVFNFLRFGSPKLYSMFDISEKYTKEEALKIMAIRFLIFQNYPKYLNITIASNISKNTIAAVVENRGKLLGVSIQHETHRVYNDSMYFAHILGYTGKISEEELAIESAKEDSDYNSTDFYGKSGLEKEMESYLRGKKGNEIITVNTAGKVIKSIYKEDPIAGNDLYLTIDKDLQISTYHLLEEKIANILISKLQADMNYGTKGNDAKGILIPIYEVYYALINNNIIDINILNNKNSTEVERSVYNKFMSKKQSIYGDFDNFLSFDNNISNNQTGDMLEYMDIFFNTIINNNLLFENINYKDDPNYKLYIKNNLSLSKLIKHFIASNYIDLDIINLSDNYFSVEEIYSKIIFYTKNILDSDVYFNKKIYKDLIFSYKITGKEICLLLYDQNVLEYNQENIDKLNNASISPYNFVINQISSLNITPGMLALEPCSGSVVITDVNNGNVLALVTYPSYDNNKLANKIDSKYYNYILNNKAGVLNNRATTEKIAPGSTFKMISAIAGLEEETIYANTLITDLGIFDKVTPEAKCHRYPGTHGSINVVSALQVSCNYFFYENAYRLSLNRGRYDAELGLSKLAKYASMLGLNEKTGIEIFETEPNISNNDPIRSSIGQGSNAYAPTHLSRYIATIANKGKVYNLTLIDKIMDKDGKLVFKKEPSYINSLDTIKPSTWDLVSNGMYSVANVSGGSVYNIYKTLPLKIAAKTGTAEISKSKPNHAWFVSYAPYDNPKISLVVAIPNGYTSGNSAELGKEIYKYYFNIDDIDENQNNNQDSEVVIYD